MQDQLPRAMNAFNIGTMGPAVKTLAKQLKGVHSGYRRTTGSLYIASNRIIDSHHPPDLLLIISLIPACGCSIQIIEEHATGDKLFLIITSKQVLVLARYHLHRIVEESPDIEFARNQLICERTGQ